MGISLQEQNLLIKLVIGMFGIAPGYTYLPVVNKGFEELDHSLTAAASALALLPQFQAQYPAGMSASAFATTFSANFLAPLGLGKDATVQRLVAEVFGQGMAPAQIILQAVLALNATTAPEYADARAALDNKAEVAYYHAQVLGRTETDFTLLAKVLENVTANPASVAAAKSVLNPPPPQPEWPAPPSTGPTFTLTVATDQPTLGAGDDWIDAPVGTWGTADKINGGAGQDRLTAVLAASSIAPTLAGVETIELTVDSASSIDMGAMTGLAQLRVEGAGALTLQGAIPDFTLQLKNRTADTRIIGSVTSSHLAVELTDMGSNAQRAVLDVGSVPTLSLTSHGSTRYINDIDLAGAAGQLTTLALAGDALLRLQLNNASAFAAGLATVDASATTGGVTIGSADAAGSLTAATTQVALGTGNDTVFMDATLSAAHSVDGGAGRDTLVLTAALGAAATHIQNVEVLRLDSSAGAIVQDAGLTQLAGMEFEVTGAPGVTLNQLADGARVGVVGSTSVLNLALAAPGGTADTLVLNLAGGVQIATLADVAGLEKLQLAIPDAAGTNATITTNAVTAAQVLTGTGNLTVIDPLVTTSFDASRYSGKLSAQAGNADTYLSGGFRNDTLVGGTGADTLMGGPGEDVIQLGVQGFNRPSGADTITLDLVPHPRARDVVCFVGNIDTGTGGATDYSAFARITDFTSQDDFAFSGADADFSLRSAGGAGPAYTGLARGSTAQGLTANDTLQLQFVPQNHTGGSLSNLSFIKLSTPVAFTTDVKGTFAAALGTGSITGLAANGNYLISVYDTTHDLMVIAVVNTGGNADGDTTLASNDFVDSSIAVVGVVSFLSSGAYYYGTMGDWDPFAAAF